MSDARQLALDSYRSIRQIHHETFLQLTRLKAAVARDRDIESATDAIGVLKKSFDMVKDLKMEVDKATEQLEKVVCALYMRGDSIGEPIRGMWVTGSPGGKTRLKLPSKQSPEYTKFLKDIGVDGPSASAGLVRPHWPSVQEYLNKLEEEGAKLPAGVADPNQSETEFAVRCVFHRDVDLDSLCEGDLNVD